MLDFTTGEHFSLDRSAATNIMSQGLPQYIQVTFPAPVRPRRLKITFQGGFVGKTCAIEVIPSADSGSSTFLPLTKVFPEDVNREQSFILDEFDALSRGILQIKLVFEESSDFFGRITIYDLRIQGDIL
jgi:hypothetical protein